jgi:hypothetical protein
VLIIPTGYEPAVGFSSQQLPGDKSEKACDLPLLENSPASWPVLVTSGSSIYDPDVGLRIHEAERFDAFLARLQVRIRCTKSKLSINSGDLVIGFHRTLRIPEDGTTHQLPADFGRFHLSNMALYDAKLRKSGNASLIDMANKGGVFFPAYQREAMWISFQSRKREKYAVRVFVGGVNAISGRLWDAPRPVDAKQDYVVVPPQMWLDGIAVGKGTVGQFVAMPIGSGYSVEKQITGKEDVGGLQLEITPSSANLLFTRYPALSSSPSNSDEFELQQCPRDCGISPGTDVFLTKDGNSSVFMDGKIRDSRPHMLRELEGNWLKSEPRPVLVALYPVKLSITFPSLFKTRRLTTKEFSPFNNVLEVIIEVNEGTSHLVLFHDLFHGKTKAPLNDNASLLEAGLVLHPEIIARRNRSRKSDEDSTISFRPGCSARGLRYFLMAPISFLCPRLTQWSCCQVETEDCETGSDHDPSNYQSTSLRDRPTGSHTPPVESWAMGIAAGGLLRQRILPDINRDWHTWNKSATCLVSVQLLNTVAYESLTGKLAPPTPITAEAYVEAGIPFYAEKYKDGSEAGVDGAAEFGKLKSVAQIDTQKGVASGADITVSTRVACSACTRKLCDCMYALRPFGHLVLVDRC